jgi:hypothetical protein
MDRHPYIVKPNHPTPIQHTPPRTAPWHPALSAISPPRTAPRPPTTRMVNPHHASAPPPVRVRCPASARPRSLHGQPIPPASASQRTYLACASRHVCTSTVVRVLPRVVHVAASGERRVGVSSLLQARQVVHMALLPCCVCGYGTLRCTAESNRVCGAMHTPVCCSTVVDAARNGGSGSPAHSSHVCGCDLQATLSTLSTRTATPAAAQQNTRPILSTGPRSSSGEL